jgi:hypothetical protein
MTELDDSFIILKYNVFIDRAPCTKLHKREQKDSTKTLPEFPNHVTTREKQPISISIETLKCL